MSAPGSVTAEGEDFAQLVLDGAGVGQHAVGFWPAAVAGVEQDGLPYARELGEQDAHGQVQSGAAGFEPHEVGDLQGEYAGEHVHSDVVLGPVVHRGERHDAAVLELPEGELRFGLGPVAGDHLGGGPVVVAGDQDVFAEQFLFQGGAGCLVDGPGQAQAGGLVTVQLPGDDAPHPGLAGNCLDLGFDLAPGAAGPGACQGGGKFLQLAAGPGQGGGVATPGP